MIFQQFSPEMNRVRANLSGYYAQWLDLHRSAANASYGLKWKTISGTRYLYETFDRNGNGRSLGPESPELLNRHEKFNRDRANFKQDLEAINKTIAETAQLYAALNLPMLDANAAEIFREADVAGMLGTQLLTVGTNAMAAYEMEAGGRFLMGFDATADCDLAFRGTVTTFTAAAGRQLDQTLLGLLKRIDATYTVNHERSFQARNRKGFEIELLAAPSVLTKLPSGELVPVENLIEQEWLLLGRPVEQVVLGLDRKPARTICPDPRWMALHKSWLAEQPKRRADKRQKDGEQGRRLFSVIQAHMPQYPFDDAFVASIPEILQPVYAKLASQST